MSSATADLLTVILLALIFLILLISAIRAPRG
jgi:hypothetical protein